MSGAPSEDWKRGNVAAPDNCYQISKQFEFSASHRLEGLPKNHPCARMHGHNYIVEIVLRSSALNQVGFIVDYGNLAPIKGYIDRVVDHRHLNDVFQFNPTAENLARFFFEMCHELWPQVLKVRVSETPKTWAEYGKLG